MWGRSVCCICNQHQSRRPLQGPLIKVGLSSAPFPLRERHRLTYLFAPVKAEAHNFQLRFCFSLSAIVREVYLHNEHAGGFCFKSIDEEDAIPKLYWRPCSSLWNSSRQPFSHVRVHKLLDRLYSGWDGVNRMWCFVQSLFLSSASGA